MKRVQWYISIRFVDIRYRMKIWGAVRKPHPGLQVLGPWMLLIYFPCLLLAKVEHASSPPTLTGDGWSLHRPPLPRIYTPQSCASGVKLACDAGVCMATKILMKAKHNATYTDQLCERCECALCLVCAKLVNRWTSPLGQTLETVTARTRPPFTFAFNPADADMQRMRQQLILEPLLTLAWHESLWRCCRQPGALVVDVGGNFGWYTLYSLALGCSVVVFEQLPMLIAKHLARSSGNTKRDQARAITAVPTLLFDHFAASPAGAVSSIHLQANPRLPRNPRAWCATTDHHGKLWPWLGVVCL